MTYESEMTVDSTVAAGVTYTVAKVSFERRLELMRNIRDLARRLEFLEAGKEPVDKMDAAVLRAEVDRIWLLWGLRGVSGLEVDGMPATPESLADAGPEELCREALAAVQAQTGLSAPERKN
jgi:hypothetical protein